MDTDTPELTDEQQTQLAQVRQLVEMARAMGAPAAVTDRVGELADQLERGQQIDSEQVELELGDLLSALQGEAAAPELADAAELGEAELVEPEPDLIGVLADAALAGQPVVLSSHQAGLLAELASFCVYARDNVYPVVHALEPLARRIQQLGPELGQLGPVELAQVVAAGLKR